MTEIKLFLLGSLHIEIDGETLTLNRRKSLALLSYLALTRTPQSRDKIATLLWEDFDQVRARAALRTCISELKNSPIGDCLLVERETIALTGRCNLWIDVRQFQDLLSDTLEEEAISPEKYDLLEEAVELYRDDFMSGFSLRDSVEFDEWQSAQTERLHRDLLRVIEHLVQGYIAMHDIDNAIRHARRWLTFDPLNEQAHYLLMTLYHQSGQRVAALQQYEEYARLLDEELGLEPHRQIAEFYERIKSSDSSLTDFRFERVALLPAQPTLAVGRTEDVTVLKVRLIEGNALTIVQGWPGVGKSTLAALLAHDDDLHQHFSGGVLWTSLGEDPNLLAKLGEWGQALGSGDVAQAKSVTEAGHMLRAMLQQKRILLIVDDVWQIEHGTAFKLAGANSAVVYTTRFNDVANALAAISTDVYKLGILSEAQSLTLLESLAPSVIQDHLHQARTLVNDLEGLPLSLQVAGRLLQAEAAMGWGVEELLTELHEGKALLQATAPADRIDPENNMIPTVAVLLERSVARLQPEMQERFALLGVFAPKPATFDLPALGAVWAVDDPRASARILVDRGLLEPTGNGRFQMHALLAMHARSMFEN